MYLTQLKCFQFQTLTVESLDTATTLALRVDDQNDDSARILAHALVPNNVLFEPYRRNTGRIRFELFNLEIESGRTVTSYNF